jgi:hypothetical protein
MGANSKKRAESMLSGNAVNEYEERNQDQDSDHDK